MAKPNDIYKSYIGSQFLSDMLGKPIKSIFIGPQWAAYFGTNLQMPFELRGQFAGIALALSQFAGLNKITADDVFILLKKDIWETGEETPYKQMERFAESLVNHSDPFSVRLNERMVFHKIEFDDHAEDDVNPNESNHFSIKLFLDPDDLYVDISFYFTGGQNDLPCIEIEFSKPFSALRFVSQLMLINPLPTILVK